MIILVGSITLLVDTSILLVNTKIILVSTIIILVTNITLLVSTYPSEAARASGAPRMRGLERTGPNPDPVRGKVFGVQDSGNKGTSIMRN